MTDRGKSLLLGLATLLACFLLAEVGLRTYQRIAKGVPFFTPLPGYRPTRFAISPFLVHGPRRDWQIEGRDAPETSYFNDQGFRTLERLGPKPPGEIRIIALGGSTTENAWNTEGTHWPLELERELRRAGHGGVRVYNGGMSAYSSAHSLVRLAQDALHYDPDLVLVMHNVNDLTVNYHAVLTGQLFDHNYLVKYGKKSLTGEIDSGDVVLSRVWAAVSSRLGGSISQDPAVFPDDYSTDAGLDVFRRHLVSLDAVARAHGAELVLLTMPVSRDLDVYAYTQAHQVGRIDRLPPRERFLADFDRYNEAIRQVGRDRGIRVVDMAALFPEDDGLFADVVHYTAEGLRRFGRTLAPRLAPALVASSAAGTPGASAPPQPLAPLTQRQTLRPDQ